MSGKEQLSKLHMATVETLGKKYGSMLTMNDATDIYKAMKNVVVSKEQIDGFQDVEPEQFIQSASNFENELYELFDGDYEMQGDLMPWAKTHNMFRFRKSELTMWGGYSRHKKSMTISHLILHLIAQGKKVCIASMEMPPKVQLKRMVIQAVGNPHPTKEMQKKFMAWISGKLFIYNQRGSVNTQSILKMTRYASKELGCDHVFIDSLMKCGMATDDYSGQKRFIDELQSCANDFNNHVHIVAHMKKPPAENYVPNMYDISGGADLVNQPDNVILVWADLEKERERKNPPGQRKEDVMARPEQKIIIDKQRNEEFTGWIIFDFDPRSLQTYDGKPQTYVQYFAESKQPEQEINIEEMM